MNFRLFIQPILADSRNCGDDLISLLAHRVPEIIYKGTGICAILEILFAFQHTHRKWVFAIGIYETGLVFISKLLFLNFIFGNFCAPFIVVETFIAKL